ncbi:hypothetical protein KIL84_005302 [Mauremys mutica]|uniref:Uncharacterized protein n=1 Tax=Mauremys mutica TaxID=74926 RepID=A0A9D4B5P9_9SAUR|nr:hypothetical protein KIL84_005302 [Mauremys mutica]
MGVTKASPWIELQHHLSGGGGKSSLSELIQQALVNYKIAACQMSAVPVKLDDISIHLQVPFQGKSSCVVRAFVLNSESDQVSAHSHSSAGNHSCKELLCSVGCSTYSGKQPPPPPLVGYRPLVLFIHLINRKDA